MNDGGADRHSEGAKSAKTGKKDINVRDYVNVPNAKTAAAHKGLRRTYKPGK
jgi:hypothetical protein